MNTNGFNQLSDKKLLAIRGGFLGIPGVLELIKIINKVVSESKPKSKRPELPTIQPTTWMAIVAIVYSLREQIIKTLQKIIEKIKPTKKQIIDPSTRNGLKQSLKKSLKQAIDLIIAHPILLSIMALIYANRKFLFRMATDQEERTKTYKIGLEFISKNTAQIIAAYREMAREEQKYEKQREQKKNSEYEKREQEHIKELKNELKKKE